LKALDEWDVSEVVVSLFFIPKVRWGKIIIEF
jgi:hypothetical protein